jgi:integrase
MIEASPARPSARLYTMMMTDLTPAAWMMLRQLFRRVFKKLQFCIICHTFASLLIQNGESLTYIKDQLGHSSIKTTVDIYGHLVPGANRQAMNRLPVASKSAHQTHPGQNSSLALFH